MLFVQKQFPIHLLKGFIFSGLPACHLLLPWLSSEDDRDRPRLHSEPSLFFGFRSKWSLWPLLFRPRTLRLGFNMKEIYERLYDQEFSLIPIKKGTKIPGISWAPFQSSRASKPQLDRWFRDESNTIGIVTGHISDLVVVLS